MSNEFMGIMKPVDFHSIHLGNHFHQLERPGINDRSTAEET